MREVNRLISVLLKIEICRQELKRAIADTNLTALGPVHKIIYDLATETRDALAFERPESARPRFSENDIVWTESDSDA